jgi:Protein of unknown function (DUF1761)
MEVEINAWAVIIAAAAGMVVGSLWYSKSFFGKQWAGILKLKEDKMKEYAPKAITRAVFSALLTAYILSHVIAFAVAFFPDRTEVSVGLSTALSVWIGFYFTQLFMLDGFEQRPLKLTMINACNHLVTLLAMGLIIASITY